MLRGGCLRASQVVKAEVARRRAHAADMEQRPSGCLVLGAQERAESRPCGQKTSPGQHHTECSRQIRNMTEKMKMKSRTRDCRDRGASRGASSELP